MWWRVTASEFDEERGEGTRKAMKDLVEKGEVPGILGYANNEPIGWCSLAPREKFGRLERSPVLGRVDDTPVWSIVCFFVARDYRRLGVSKKLLEGAIEYARKQGARVLEAYPIDPKKVPYPAPSAWTGFASTFYKLGFREVLRRKDTRPIMRYVVPGRVGQDR